ncbi:uncharacterized protein LOC106873365 [Octopus bimaculoides]|uniref:Calcium signal-modulating cyclophilin ligand n=1 Tax=Octopus bimaculoides TaxID=37653 RepID=A0A0L8H330_OCTBM|nr:uncharacterized protein LOC106873365 [Octopus bimaculoides]|eukprot:XP_014776181.1 PREDICTED: uncharacterized protein LOC106873365 [Octopus bimaculoides]
MAGSVEDARRERRQRLLRFSEERFKKILQNDNFDSNSDTGELSQGTLQTEDDSNVDPSECHSDEDISIGLRHRTEGASSRSVSKELTPEASLPKTEKTYTHKTVKTNDAFAESKFPGITSGGSATGSQREMSSPVSSNTTSAASSAYGGNRFPSGNASKATLSLLHFDLARLVSCMILAFITRKILNSSWSLFFAESIIVPFTLLQFGFYTFLPKFCKAVVLPKRGSLIDSGLALCGVDRSFIDTYQRVIAYTTSIAEDFAVYMFTFFLVDSLIG